MLSFDIVKGGDFFLAHGSISLEIALLTTPVEI